MEAKFKASVNLMSFNFNLKQFQHKFNAFTFYKKLKHYNTQLHTTKLIRQSIREKLILNCNTNPINQVT